MRKGFTLIEVLIVVVIIGILAAVAIPKFKSINQREQQRQSQTVAGQRDLIRYEDKSNGVTCYRVVGYDGFSCIKTSQTF